MLLVGFQAAGTLGRILQDGASTVKIQGEEIAVRARIRAIDVYSGHADGPELVAWLNARQPLRKALFLVHGEEEALAAMKMQAAKLIDDERVIIPGIDPAFGLDPDGPVNISKSLPLPRLDPLQPGHRDWNNDFQGLILDLQMRLRSAADDKARRVIIRRIRDSLEL